MNNKIYKNIAVMSSSITSLIIPLVLITAIFNDNNIFDNIKYKIFINIYSIFGITIFAIWLIGIIPCGILNIKWIINNYKLSRNIKIMLFIIFNLFFFFFWQYFFIFMIHKQWFSIKIGNNDE